MCYSLIIPIAANKPEYSHAMPYVFCLDTDGYMRCVKTILGLNLNVFKNIYFTILKSHDEHYCLSDLFYLQFRRLQLSNAKVVVLDKSTSSQPETVYQTIKRENIKGPIFIKDADTCFSCEITVGNRIAIYPLEKLSIVNPQHKSYVTVDDMFYVTNIIEKRIISHYFSAGGYGFEDAKEFCLYFSRLQHYQELYLSHIIYAMLLDKIVFRPILLNDYIDFELNEKTLYHI